MVSRDMGDLSAGAPRVESALHVIQGTVVEDGSNSSTTFETDLPSTDNDFYNNMEIVFVSGDNAGQVRRISDYVGGTLFITVDSAFLGEPDAGDVFYIIPRIASAAGAVTDESIADQVWDEAQSGHVAAGSMGKQISDIEGYVDGMEAALLGEYDTEMARITANVALASVLGALNTAAAQDGDATTDTAMALIKGLHDVLWDADGVVAWPAGAAPTNGVSIAEAIRYISERIDDQANKNVWWSDVQEEVQLGDTAADVTFPSVTLPNITGTLVRVYGAIKFRAIENTNASANKLSGADNIKIIKNGGSWGTDDVALINFVDDALGVAASTREGGDVIVGDNDVVGEVDAFNQQYDIRWEDGQTDYDNLNFNDVQVGLIVEWY